MFEIGQWNKLWGWLNAEMFVEKSLSIVPAPAYIDVKDYSSEQIKIAENDYMNERKGEIIIQFPMAIDTYASRS